MAAAIFQAEHSLLPRFLGPTAAVTIVDGSHGAWCISSMSSLKLQSTLQERALGTPTLLPWLVWPPPEGEFGAGPGQPRGWGGPVSASAFPAPPAEPGTWTLWASGAPSNSPAPFPLRGSGAPGIWSTAPGKERKQPVPAVCCQPPLRVLPAGTGEGSGSQGSPETALCLPQPHSANCFAQEAAVRVTERLCLQPLHSRGNSGRCRFRSLSMRRCTCPSSRCCTEVDATGALSPFATGTPGLSS